MYRGGGEYKKKKMKIENRKKKSSSRPFLANPAGGQETIFYLRMALFIILISLRSKRTPCRTGAYQIPPFRMGGPLKISLPQEHRPCPIQYYPPSSCKLFFQSCATVIIVQKFIITECPRFFRNENKTFYKTL